MHDYGDQGARDMVNLAQPDELDYEDLMRGQIHDYLSTIHMNESSSEKANKAISQIVSSFLFKDEELIKQKLQMQLN